MSRTPDARGSTLVLAMVLLAVLSVVGVAAVSLAQQERTNAAAYGKRDALAACARAAQMAMWAELARFGRNHLDAPSPIFEITLPDGTRLASPAHYDTEPTATFESLKIERSLSLGPSSQVMDLTNSFKRVLGEDYARAYSVVARCKDPKGRAYEVEFTTAFAL